MEINRGLSRIKSFIHFFRILIAVTKRSLIVDFRYKFQIVVEATWTAINVAVFVLLGAAWQETAQSTGVPYTMITFFIIAVGFFTFLSGIMETTVTAISEENQLGTMGFLVTNSVSPIAIILGRYISATIRWLAILVVIVIPPLILKGVVPTTFELLWASIVILFISWIFTMGFTLLLTSINLLIKRTTTFNRVAIYIVRFAAGAFVPIISFDNSIQIFGKPLSNYLIWFPLAFCLEVLRWTFTVKSTDALQNPTLSSKDGEAYEGFNSIFDTNASNFTFSDPMVQQMLLISCMFLVISLILVSRMTTMARKWGTIEFY
ncbi:MAG: hypothetical protein ACXAD7_02705 [Candidatus Kariarchaeaceae archaeon]|jgi:hypothetical protein